MRNDIISSKFDKSTILADYRLINESRHASILGRKEVLGGNAKFGIFGDGKELAQVAMAKVFQNGDWRSGYYRDQTFMLAIGALSIEEIFAQLYGDTDIKANPGNGGRLMNNHFSTRSIDDQGNWKNLTSMKNSSADISPTAGQMPRLLGLAYASKLFRNVPEFASLSQLSDKGNEVAFGTIGDASTSEGHFFETLNAAGVLQVPLAISVWDDGFGISVPIKYQTTKQNISELLSGFEKTDDKDGFLIFKAKGWDYPGLCDMYEKGIAICREKHIPVLFHITEVTQPQGHSTSGSHERYKSAERMQWELDYDCISRMREWILNENIATTDELTIIEKEAIEFVKDAKSKAWQHFQNPIIAKRNEFIEILDNSTCNCLKQDKINKIKEDLMRIPSPIKKDYISASRKILRFLCSTCSPNKPMKQKLRQWLNSEIATGKEVYGSHLYSESELSALNVKEIAPEYSDNSKVVTGREILLANHEKNFVKYPTTLIFGEDVGKLGGVNQTLEGMQAKFGELRVSDTGIREATIIGQGIGLAVRGLRPIAEIQYFDYLLYALEVMSDDLATLQYRTKGGQKAPLIISTRGHRLEGIWHSGSPLSMVINAIRGIYVCVPRNMTQAAGFYNTALASDDPFLIIEPLNGYRLKEKLPENIGEYRIPLGKPEVLKQGNDVTVVTYGSCVRIAQDALKQLEDFGISCELIDVQTLLPFDLNHVIIDSLKKTNKILFFDEDVPGGATAYMMQQVLEIQGGYLYLDGTPKTLTSKGHRPAYSTDGDYFSNPNAEDVFDMVYSIMNEYNPQKYPDIY
jgi:2-oxoisovalerate dehydrogenase E1 component